MMITHWLVVQLGVFVCCFGGGARQFSLENARAIAVNKSPEQRA
jgi:hypothetical protein